MVDLEDAPVGPPPARKKKGPDPYYMSAEHVWWYTEGLPNRWRGCKTWSHIEEAAIDYTTSTIYCLAEDCNRTWAFRADGGNPDMQTSLWALYQHMDAMSTNEVADEIAWHPSEPMMAQLLACWKRG